LLPVTVVFSTSDCVLLLRSLILRSSATSRASLSFASRCF
jgi:hypothetical protein